MANIPVITQADIQSLTATGIDAYQEALANAAVNPLDAAISQIGQTLAARGMTAEQILQLQLLLREAMQNLLREFAGTDSLPVLRSGLGELLSTLFDTTLAPSVAEALPDFSSRNNRSLTDIGIRDHGSSQAGDSPELPAPRDLGSILRPELTALTMEGSGNSIHAQELNVLTGDAFTPGGLGNPGRPEITALTGNGSDPVFVGGIEPGIST